MRANEVSRRALLLDFITVLTIGGLVAVVVLGYVWGWWAALLAVGLLLVLWLAGDSVVERFRWKRRGLLNSPTLRNVSSWLYRSDVEMVLAQLGAGEKVLLAVPATRQDPDQNGVLVLTSNRVLFRRSGTRKDGLLSVTRGSVEAVSVNEDRPWAYLQLTTADRLLVFRLLSREKQAWTLAGHFLAEMHADVDAAASGDPLTQLATAPQSGAAPDSNPERTPTHLTVSPAARREIERRGGTLYLWQEEFTANLVVDKLDTRAPRTECEFESLESDGVSVLIDARVPQAETIAVGLRRFPRRRIEVVFDGLPWGRRGVMVD